MPTRLDQELPHRLQQVSVYSGPVLALAGVTVLGGWLLEIESVKRIIPGLVAMNPFTALGFIAAGLSLYCFWQPEPHLSRIGAALGGGVAFMGLLKLVCYGFGLPFHFDQALFAEQIQSDKNVANQIAPNTALNFLIAGTILLLLYGSQRRFSKWAQNLSLALAFISLVPLVGYLYQATYLYSIGSYIPMALHTAIFFLLLSCGLLLTQWEAGVVALFTSATPGGVTARRLLPFALVLPLALGAFAVWGIKARFYPHELGVTIVMVGSSAAFTVLIWRNARLLNYSDRQRSTAEAKLQTAYSELELRVQQRTGELAAANDNLCLQIRELQAAQEIIHEQAELLNQAQDAILVLDTSHRIVFWNRGAERLYGWTSEQVFEKAVETVLLKEAVSLATCYEAVARTGIWIGELELVTKAGQSVIVESRWTLLKGESDTAKGILTINTDVTEKKSYEAQLRRAQRMESIGALASGIAHDLNNALTPVIMGADLLRQSRSDDERRRLLDMMVLGAKRGTEMVRQILSFARGSKPQSGQVPVKHLINEMVKIVRDTFPKSISIDCIAPTKLWPIRGDMTELHQVLLNLCVNARDAMPEGGRLTIRAENQRLHEPRAAGNSSIPAGRYVMLAISDTGTGIAPEVLPRIFEPFYTTKSPDKGTGLGLSTVKKIMKEHQGFLNVRSELGKGTTFMLHLPVAESAEGNCFEIELVEPPHGHGELILIIDDEEAVRELAKTTLENYGYRTLTAANGAQGIVRFEEHREEIKLVVTDSEMPVLDGQSAIRAIRQLKSSIPIIIASGAKQGAGFIEGIEPRGLLVLSKPYNIEQLLNGVAGLLRDGIRPADCN